MTGPIISVRGISKRYRLGEIGASSLRDELQRLGTSLRSRLRGQASTPDTAAKRDFWALRDVSFDVSPGDVVGIIGHNGAGKSTLLKILSRITEPTTGEIRLRGRLASLLEVGTGFHPELSGRDNIFLNGAILGMGRAEIARKFDEIVAFSEVGPFLDTPVKRYSSGMYVRLAFAVAAHLEPEILVVDEVLAVGDVAFQRKCLGKMEDITTRDGRTILFVSHNMTAIRRLCQRCIVLDHGRASPVLPVDQAVELYTSRQSISTASVDLRTRGRHTGQGTFCRLTSMEVVGGSFRYGEPGAVDVTFEALQPIRGLMVGLGFNTLEGHRLLTLDSDTAGHPFDVEPGSHTARVGLPFWPLHPGSYASSVALIQGHNCLDSVGSAAVWEVQTSPVDNVSDRGYGACRLKPEVSLRPAS